jgi:hypothetical protein
MKIIILGKRDQMGTMPVIRIKGMSRLLYIFEWDKESRHYAYEPKDQKEADDIFRTQGRLYKRMFFSVLLEKPKEELKLKKTRAPKVKKEKLESVTKLQAVVGN